MNNLTNNISQYISALGASIYKDVVTSSTSDRIILITQTIAGGILLAKSLGNGPQTLLVPILEGVAALHLYRNLFSFILFTQLEAVKKLSNEVDNVKVFANLSNGLKNVLSNTSYEWFLGIGICYAAAVGMGVVLTKKKIVSLEKLLIDVVILHFIVNLYASYKLQQIGATINSANIWHPPMSCGNCTFTVI